MSEQRRSNKQRKKAHKKEQTMTKKAFQASLKQTSRKLKPSRRD